MSSTGARQPHWLEFWDAARLSRRDHRLRAAVLSAGRWGGEAPARVQQALGRGGDPNSRDANGYTPLHYAVRQGSFRVIKLLLEHGADPRAEGPNGLLPIDMSSDERVTRLLPSDDAHSESVPVQPRPTPRELAAELIVLPHSLFQDGLTDELSVELGTTNLFVLQALAEPTARATRGAEQAAELARAVGETFAEGVSEYVSQRVAERLLVYGAEVEKESVAGQRDQLEPLVRASTRVFEARLDELGHTNEEVVELVGTMLKLFTNTGKVTVGLINARWG